MKKIIFLLLSFCFIAFGASWQKISASAPTSNNLLSLFQFDGNFNDSQGANTITPSGITFVSGKNGQAALFNGASNSGVLGTTPPLSGDMSISGWIKTTQAGTYGSIISNAPTQYAAAIKIIIDINGKINARRGNSVGLGGGYLVSCSSLSSINDGSFHHFVVASDSSSLKIYIDGILEASSSYSGAVGLAPQMYIGKDVDQSGVSFNYLNGAVDALRIYNRVLSSSEIQSIYQAGN